ncbi:dynamin family protein [Azotobacter beijerinckii]|uniref:Dynamin family protein n=1 Tax=Azotobacter beijerinckii TaxID=170623 RepID=A0A1I4FEK4_9GAMM|nr:dynamin family protein [Azotobacter beijerinckii]SFB52146.1 Dynamin family protein [Azotobacter beijerinckii]SFL16362.1 Dynamin family protein [Azotobacter beijerinckii]
MKAGKSSFLNAAFFGRNLLPKADTPMTAALTKIVYAPKARAEVVFYSADDWAGIEQRAREYPQRYAGEEQRLIAESKTSPFAPPRQPSREEVNRCIPESIKSSLELVEKAREHRLDVRNYLGKTEVLENVEGAENLARALHEYVGSGGRFTAITKMTVLHVDDLRLEGLEIIDTPGFNDPVVSRGQITRGFLGQCDVIFLLSAVSQFLTSSDMAVLREQLPEAGIDDKAVFLVGSQRDIALRQDRGIATTASKLAERVPPEQRTAARASAMMQLPDKKLTEQANLTLDAQINQPGQDGKTRRILGAVRQTAPRFVSGWAWLVAEQFADLADDDRYQLDQLCTATGYPFEPDSLRRLSNIPPLREEILSQRERKQQLIAGKERALIEGVRNGTRERLEQIASSLQERGERIRNGDIGALEKTEQDMLKRMSGGRARLEDVFDGQVVKARQQFSRLETNIREQAQKCSRIEVVREKTVESYQVDTSWFGGLFGHDWETRYRNVVTVYASAQDAIEQVQSFALQTTKSLQEAIIDCVDLDELRSKVGVAAMSLFDTGSADFDADLMLAEVNKSLRHITIPDVSFGRKDYSQEIIKTFGSDRVDEDEIKGLKKAQHEAVAAIIADLEAEVARKIKAIETSLDATGKTFVENMTRDIQQSLTQLRADIANQEQAIRQIAAARQAVDEALAAL